MVRRIGFCVWCNVFLSIWSSQISQATTNCNQSFTFLFAAADHSRVFWIVEDVGGECLYSRLIQVVAKDDYATTIYTRFGGYQSWKWLQDNVKHIVKEPAIQLENHDGVWITPDTSWRIAVPPPDSALLRLFQEEYAKGGERSWNVKYGIKGVSVPSAEALNIDVVYYYPEGLYIDYTLSNVYYFPRSGYVLVFTNQRRLASGLDTMHGFLLLKIIKESGG